jgi:hypothetical protein
MECTYNRRWGILVRKFVDVSSKEEDKEDITPNIPQKKRETALIHLFALFCAWFS